MTHRDVPIRSLQHAASTNTTSHDDTPLVLPDERAAEQGARFLSTGHNMAHSKSSQVAPQNVNWRFFTVNMTAFSTQHRANLELGCHVCRWQETHLTEFGQAWAREVMKERELGSHYAPPGKRDQGRGVANVAGLGVE